MVMHFSSHPIQANERIIIQRARAMGFPWAGLKRLEGMKRESGLPVRHVGVSVHLSGGKCPRDLPSLCNGW